MNRIGKTGQIIGSALVVVLMFCVSSVMAETISSPSYKINGNLGGSFGGQASSTSYSMTSIGGEAVVGSGSSGSYIIDQQQTSSTAQTMQLGVQPSGLVAYYPMDENTGTATADASQYQHDGTLNGTAGWYTGGKLGSAVDMNGATDSTGTSAVLVSDNNNLPAGNPMTVEAWVRQSAWYSNQAIASHWKYDFDNPQMSASWALQTGLSNNLRVFIADSQTDVGANYIDTDTGTWNSFNTWRHVVMVYDGSQAQANKVKVYIDGTLAGSTAYGTLPSTLQDSTGSFSIGSFPGLGRAMTGAIDHVKLFNRALTSDEITAEYGAQNAGIATGLTLGTLTGSSTTSLVDAIIRTNATSYNLAIQQDHDLQSGVDTIPAIGGSIGSPLTWSEGVTKGLGFTLTGAPTLDSKWNSGAKYAAVPSASTTFYDGTGHVNGTIDVINLRLRLDAPAAQTLGTYANTITYTGTIVP
jgi:hypothetical protein